MARARYFQGDVLQSRARVREAAAPCWRCVKDKQGKDICTATMLEGATKQGNRRGAAGACEVISTAKKPADRAR